MTNRNRTQDLSRKLSLVVAGMFLCGLPGTPGRAAHAGTLAVRAVSPRPGLLFADNEKVDVRARVSGTNAAATVSFAAWDPDGACCSRGEVELAAPGGAAEAPLPLKLPGRGLYKLKLTAVAGGQRASAETHVAVVFTPPKPDASSPWGIFYTPHTWFRGGDPNGPAAAALSHRLLGASWSRLNFWAHSVENVRVTGEGEVTFDVTTWKGFARALRAEGITILGEIAQCPRALSSRPDAAAVRGDAGPVWCRVKPRDYKLWERFIEKLAREFRDEIGVWEIWNEANLKDRYWTGTLEDFAVHVERTARALRRGNPKARIAAAGFVHDLSYVESLLRLGMGRHVDILSVHYTDERPEEIPALRRLLGRHGLTLPIWNTEERSEVPLRDLASPVERSFKFLHVTIGYEHMRPLVRQDWTVLPAGILYSVGAHCIGTAAYAGRCTQVKGWDVFYFRRGREQIAAFDRRRRASTPKLFGAVAEAVALTVEPLPGRRPTVTDMWGRSRPLKLRDGAAELELAGRMVFLNGCAKVGVGGYALGRVENAHVFEAEDGRWSAGWHANAKAGFSGGRILELWKREDPPAGGYWAERKLRVPRDGTYAVLFSGNSLARLKPPPSISPFEWRIGDGEPRVMNAAAPVHHDVPGAPEGLSVLGKVYLRRGEHTFRLKLLARRKAYDTAYALWFDAIVLRRR